MIVLDLSILNQKGTPMFNSDTFANRPAFGIVGRIFISTDTKEFYRDTGTSWELIGGPGSGTITGSGTTGTLPIWNGSSVIGDSSLLEGASKISTTKSIQAASYFLTGMTAGSGALYWTSDRVTLANYNVGGIVHIEVNGGSAAQIIAADLSTTFYGGIIRNGGLSTQFLKADGSLDSSTYITTNIYNGNGTLTGNRVVSLNSNYLSFAGGQTYIGSQTTSSGLLTINNSVADSHLQVVGANSPSIRIDNAGSGGTQRFVFGLATATNNFIQGATAGQFCISTQSAGAMLFGMWQTTNASEVMRISTANNLIIGSTTDNGDKAQIAGNLNLVAGGDRIFSINDTGGNLFQIQAASNILYYSARTSGGSLAFRTNGTNDVKVTISSTGRLGIGTQSPQELLVVSNGGTENIEISSGYIQSFNRSSPGYANINFYASSYIYNVGNIGIGTGGGVIPSKLTINGNNVGFDMQEAGTSRFRAELGGNNTYLSTIGAYDMVLRTNQTTAMTITLSQNVLIGTSTDIGYRLYSYGSFPFRTYTPDGNGITINPSYNYYDAYNHVFRSLNGTTTYATFTNNGNLLINSTTDQGQKLYLNGSLRIDGQTAATAGGSSGQHLIINCDGTTYKIALLNN